MACYCSPNSFRKRLHQSASFKPIRFLVNKGRNKEGETGNHSIMRNVVETAGRFLVTFHPINVSAVSPIV